MLIMNAFNRLELQTLSRNDAFIENAVLSPEVLEVVKSQRYGIEYQPIVDVRSGEVEGYQASARFWNKNWSVLSPQKMFANLRHDPYMFFRTELALQGITD